MKTKEELNALKEEGTPLTEEELEQVTGGNSTPSVVDEEVLVNPAIDGPISGTRDHTLL